MNGENTGTQSKSRSSPSRNAKIFAARILLYLKTNQFVILKIVNTKKEWQLERN